MDNFKTQIVNELLLDIDSKTFELEAWKQKAVLVLKKIVGENDEKIGLIESLHYDFSSWSLRDSSGGKANDKTKETARKIIEAALVDIKLQQGDTTVSSILKDELTGNEFTKVMDLIGEKENNIEGLAVYFSNLQPATKDRLLARIVSKSLKE